MEYFLDESGNTGDLINKKNDIDLPPELDTTVS